MLSKNDLSKIENVFDKKMKDSLTDFFEKLILPYFEHNEKDHEDMKKEMTGLKQEMTGLKQEMKGLNTQMEDVKEYIKNHEHRIQKVEALTALKN